MYTSERKKEEIHEMRKNIVFVFILSNTQNDNEMKHKHECVDIGRTEREGTKTNCKHILPAHSCISALYSLFSLLSVSFISFTLLFFLFFFFPSQFMSSCSRTKQHKYLRIYYLQDCRINIVVAAVFFLSLFLRHKIP